MPVVGIPQIPVIPLVALSVGFTFAPDRGAIPNPPVDPRDTITPPLGSRFWLTLFGSIIISQLVDVIPVNDILVEDADPTYS